MKALKKISLIFVLFFLYTFVLSRNYLPETIAVKGEEIRISDIEVIPVGEVIGIKLYTSGVLVVGTAKIDGADGNSYKPYENTDIKEGDSIIKVAGEYVNSTEELINIVNRNGENPISINYIRNNNENVRKFSNGSITFRKDTEIVKNKTHNYAPCVKIEFYVGPEYINDVRCERYVQFIFVKVI